MTATKIPSDSVDFGDSGPPTSVWESHPNVAHASRRRGRAAWRSALWFAGLGAAAALAVGPPLIEADHVSIQLSIIVGLLGVCLGLSIELLLRGDGLARQLESKIDSHDRQTFRVLASLSPVVASPRACQEFVSLIAHEWSRIDAHGSVPVLAEIRHGKCQELLSTLSNVANGAVTVSIDGQYSVRARSFDGVASYRAVSMGPLEFWDGSFGQRYLETQRQSIANDGLRVDRIFMLDESEISIAEPILLAQAQAGVAVWVVVRSWIPDIHQEHAIDQGVVTYQNGLKLLMQPIATRYRQKADLERLSVIAGEIANAEFSISILQRHSQRVYDHSPWPFSDR